VESMFRDLRVERNDNYVVEVYLVLIYFPFSFLRQTVEKIPENLLTAF
jgi:hypothetical protein